MITVMSYTAEKKTIWDGFVKTGKNRHFFFQRDYMDYHADRFEDKSLLFFDGNDLLAVLPGSRHQETYVSHGGLTFGGLIFDKTINFSEVFHIFSAIKMYLHSCGLQVLRYKAMPYIYHDIPSEEDLFLLLYHKAVLIRRDVSSTIDLKNKLGFSNGKKNGIAKAKKNGVIVSDAPDFDQFLAMMNAILQEKYQTQATHSKEEMLLLYKRFPNHIKLHSAFVNGRMVAGVVMYLTDQVAHTQYMATTEIGRETGALDLLLHILINDIYASKHYFDFGISTEQQGRFLNQGLVTQKEMFGARAIVYDTYEMNLSH